MKDVVSATERVAGIFTRLGAGERVDRGERVEKRRSRYRAILCLAALFGLTFGGIAALMWSPQRALADTSTPSTNCVVTGSSGNSGSAVPTSLSVDPASTTPNQTNLAFTGTNLASAVAMGVSLVGLGLLLVLGSRVHRHRLGRILGCAVLGLLLAHELLPTGQASAATSCASPPAALPEVSNGMLLPLSALLVCAAAYVSLRRRRALRAQHVSERRVADPENHGV
jgi:hypothetical protein